MDIGSPQLTVRRPVYQQDELHQVCDYTRPKKKIREKVSKRCERFDLKDFTKRSIPLLNWLLKYQWKKDISGDIVAGVTVAVMHIPQGMGYAMLGNVPPVIGIYMAVFPVLIYTLLGTSRHNSMGSFAVVSLMIGKVVLAKSNAANSVSLLNTTNVTSTLLETDLETGTPTYTPTEVATIITFVVGMIQLAMYLLRLGVVSTLLSETLVSGFTTGSAMHVMTSQVKDLLGLKMGKRVGIFKIVLTYYDVFANFDNINVTAVILSACTIVILTLNNQLLKPLLASKCIVPVPIEAIVVVLGTILSIYMDLAATHGVLIVGEIPVGLPSPTVPKFELVPELWFDCLIITVVSYAISMSMALIFAQRNNYEVDSNQELVAQGAGNVFGSFFSCMPFSASLSRSSIQEMVGGRTQLASLISCSLLVCILLWVGPFFEPLPKCILSSIIVVALKGMLLQVTEFIRFWRLSRVDAAVWMVTFLTVVFLDVEWGLLVGLFISVASLIGFSMSPYSCRVGLVPGTEIYLDVKRYKGTIQIPGIDVLHYCGCLNFASRQHFRGEVYKIAGCEPQKILSRRRKIAERATTQPQAKESFEKGYINEGYDRELGDESPSSNSPTLKAIVIDFSALVYIDPAGVATLRSLVDEFKKIDVVVYIAGCSGPVFETMRKCNVADGKEGHFTMFPTISDAVNFALHEPCLSLIPMASATCGIFPSPVLPVNPTHQRILPDEDECTSRL